MNLFENMSYLKLLEERKEVANDPRKVEVVNNYIRKFYEECDEHDLAIPSETYIGIAANGNEVPIVDDVNPPINFSISFRQIKKNLGLKAIYRLNERARREVALERLRVENYCKQCLHDKTAWEARVAVMSLAELQKEYRKIMSVQELVDICRLYLDQWMTPCSDDDVITVGSIYCLNDGFLLNDNIDKALGDAAGVSIKSFRKAHGLGEGSMFRLTNLWT